MTFVILLPSKSTTIPIYNITFVQIYVRWKHFLMSYLIY